MYPSPSQYPPYASPNQQPYFSHQTAARPPYSGEYDGVSPSHQSQARSPSLQILPSRIACTSTRRASESTLAHALDESSLERHLPSSSVAAQHHPSVYHSKYSVDYRYPSPSGSSQFSCSSPASPPASFYDYTIQNATQYHIEQGQSICDHDQDMVTIPEYASLTITSPLPLSTADVDEDEGMCMDGAPMSCAEYEGSQFYEVSDGGGGGPSGPESRRIDVSGGHPSGHGMITGHQYEQVEDAAGDPSFGPIYSPASSYDYDYDYDISSYDVGDTVDSPVDGDARSWGETIGSMNYQNDIPRHYSMDLPTRSYTLEAAITPPPEVPVVQKKDKKPDGTIPSQAPTRAPRGRPRKNTNRLPGSQTVPASKYRADTSTSPTASPSSQSQSPPATVSPPPISAPGPTLSMDEIPVPDAESKPGQAVFKLTPSAIPGVTSGIPGAGGAAGKEGKKKPIMACLFCRERKIACGPPAPGSANPRCNQCVRRGLECEYPKESRRGQHKRGPRAVRVQALTEEREQKASGSSSSSGTDQATTSSKSQSSDTLSSNSSSREASIKAGTKRKEKMVSNGRSSLKVKGKSSVKKEEGEVSVDTRAHRD